MKVLNQKYGILYLKVLNQEYGILKWESANSDNILQAIRVSFNFFIIWLLKFLN